MAHKLMATKYYAHPPYIRPNYEGGMIPPLPPCPPLPPSRAKTSAGFLPCSSLASKTFSSTVRSAWGPEIYYIAQENFSP